MITWEGAQLSTRGPHALTGGPSVQVQFPHLKIFTLTTAYSFTLKPSDRIHMLGQDRIFDQQRYVIDNN